MAPPERGEVWLVDLEPIRGREQAGRRPALVVSVNRLNRSPAGLVIIVPLTTRERCVPTHIPLAPPEGGVREPSWAMCENLRSVARERLVAGSFGTVAAPTLEAVADRLRLLLGL